MSTEAVDHEARSRIAEVATVLWGDDRTRDNGIRSMVKSHEARITDLEDHNVELEGKLQHYLDAERAETCLGLKALAEHEAACEDLYTEGEEEPEVKVATVNVGGQVATAKWQFWAQFATSMLSFLGIILLALLK